MKIAMTGATGLVGTALTKNLAAEGHTVYRLVRSGGENYRARDESAAPGGSVIDIPWDAKRGEVAWPLFTDLSRPENAIDAVINLAGASVGGGRWTARRKQLLYSSRIDTTRGVVRAIERMPYRPRVLVSASAVGYYGDRGEEQLTEASAPGNDFLGQLAVEWEAEARKAESLGVRVVLPRFGIILARHGGALPQMMLPFKLGVGGKLGSGRQWFPWIALDDVVSIIRRALDDQAIQGPVNLVAPGLVRNEELTKSLAAALHRPAIFTVPRFALRVALGEMAGSLLASERVLPQKLEQLGYSFLHPQLAPALAAILGH